MANQEFTDVICADTYTDAATIRDVYKSGGGVFEVAAQPALYKLQFGGLGMDVWTPEARIGAGGGTIPAGVEGIAFRNAVAGQSAVVSALIRPREQPHLSLSFASPQLTVPSGMNLISEQLATGAVGNFDFQNIDQSFKHLLCVYRLLSAVVATFDNIVLRVNNDAGFVYYDQTDIGDTAAPVAGMRSAVTEGLVCGTPGATSPGVDVWTTGQLLISRYAAVQTHSWVSHFYAPYNLGINQRVALYGGSYQVQAAITRLTFFSFAGANLQAGSEMTLYGLA